VQFVAASADAFPYGDASELQRAVDWELAAPPETLMVPPPGLRERIESQAVPVLEPPSTAEEILPDTLIVPPPGLRERLAAIAENASDTLIVPPLDFRKRLTEALDASEEPPDTLMVPPPGLHDRIGGNAMSSPAASGEPPDTLMVPPPNLHDRIGSNRFGSQPASETPPETLIVPPPGLHDLINARIEAHAQETPPDVLENAAPTPPEMVPYPPKSAGVEIVSAENASDQVIAPPPELHRRWLARKLAGDAPPDETLPEEDGE
jgi:hypothetical protein